MHLTKHSTTNMARNKTKVVRYSVSLNEAENSILQALMYEDAKQDVSGYFGFLLSEVYKQRQEGKKRPVGRPKADTAGGVPEDAGPRNIPHPDTMMHAGEFMTQAEYDTWLELKGGTLATG